MTNQLAVQKAEERARVVSHVSRSTRPTTTTTTEAPSPPPPPTTAPAPVAPAPAPGASGSEAELVAAYCNWIRPMVESYGDWPIDKMMTIAYRESKCDPQAANSTSSARGLFQTLKGTWGGYAGYATADLAPPEMQVEHAHELWLREGLSPWSETAY